MILTACSSFVHAGTRLQLPHDSLRPVVLNKIDGKLEALLISPLWRWWRRWPWRSHDRLPIALMPHMRTWFPQWFSEHYGKGFNRDRAMRSVFPRTYRAPAPLHLWEWETPAILLHIIRPRPQLHIKMQIRWSCCWAGPFYWGRFTWCRWSTRMD